MKRFSRYGTIKIKYENRLPIFVRALSNEVLKKRRQFLLNLVFYKKMVFYVLFFLCLYNY